MCRGLGVVLDQSFEPSGQLDPIVDHLEETHDAMLLITRCSPSPLTATLRNHHLQRPFSDSAAILAQPRAKSGPTTSRVPFAENRREESAAIDLETFEKPQKLLESVGRRLCATVTSEGLDGPT